MAGTIPLSMTQQFDELGRPLKGGQLYLIQAGTVSTPQDGFQDPAFVTKMPYPITLDAAGRIPQFFLADGFIKVRLQDSRGVVQFASDGIQVIGPSSGGGGGTPVDPTALIQIGNIIARYGVGVLAGYVRLNGRTIGSAVSGATERANADTQALFQYLYATDPNLEVSGGRTGSAALDWAANKTIALPDWRGYALGALDDMGTTPSGRLTAAFFGMSPIQLGAFGGDEKRTLTALNIPAITSSNPSVTFGASVNSDNWIAQNTNDSTPVNTSPGGGGPGFTISLGGGGASVAKVPSHGSATGAVAVTSDNTGPVAHATVSNLKLCTFYIKQ